MTKKASLPQLSRIRFFTCSDSDLVYAISSAIFFAATKNEIERVTGYQTAVIAWSRLLVDVENGGFVQFFRNHGGDYGIEALCELLDSLGLPETVRPLERAPVIYRENRERFEVDDPAQALSIPELDALDKPFIGAAWDRASELMEQWIRDNLHNLVVGDDGHPIDATFTGKIEIKDANGTLRESLAVKEGEADGMYWKFIKDGSVRRAELYESGEACGECWPNGQLKRKKSMRDELEVVEWYYPSGTLQKRIVQDSGGTHVEPAKLFYESGQLAEEMTLPVGK